MKNEDDIKNHDYLKKEDNHKNEDDLKLLRQFLVCPAIKSGATMPLTLLL